MCYFELLESLSVTTLNGGCLSSVWSKLKVFQHISNIWATQHFSCRICNSFSFEYFIWHSSHFTSVRIPFLWFSSQLPVSLRYLAETSVVVLSPLFLNICKLEMDTPSSGFTDVICWCLNLSRMYYTVLLLIHSITINISQSIGHYFESFLQFLKYHSVSHHMVLNSLLGYI